MDYIKMPCITQLDAPSFFMKTFMQSSKGIYHSISFILKNAYCFVGLIWVLIICKENIYTNTLLCCTIAMKPNAFFNYHIRKKEVVL